MSVMLDQRIDNRRRPEADAGADLRGLAALVDRLDELATAANTSTAPQNAVEADSSMVLASHYARANSVAQRRFDAVLAEARTISAAGLKLVESRARNDDAGTIAAARFLGNSLTAACRRLETLILPRTAC